MTRAIYLTHPEVVIDPGIVVTRWGLNDTGRTRCRAVAQAAWMAGVNAIWSSDEAKARQAAAILAGPRDLPVHIDCDLGEIGRPFFIPEPEFTRTAAACFANPDRSVRFWEPANAAQARVAAAVARAMETADGVLLFVGHGGVGAFLNAHLKGLPINAPGTKPGGYGCAFQWNGATIGDWATMEDGPPPI